MIAAWQKPLGQLDSANRSRPQHCYRIVRDGLHASVARFITAEWTGLSGYRSNLGPSFCERQALGLRS